MPDSEEWDVQDVTTLHYDYDQSTVSALLTINGTNHTGFNGNDTETNASQIITPQLIIAPALIILCVIAVIINVKILISVRWIRRPLTPTLHISLSLAAADTCIATMLATGLTMNSFVPYLLGREYFSQCVILTVEAFRLSAVLITTFHLLALAGNHYFGILCPFQSRRFMTHTNLNLLTIFLWVTPTVFMFSYFSCFENQGYRANDCDSPEMTDFIRKQQFRTIFSSVFFVLLVIMFVIYFHISIIVRKHQASRRCLTRHSRRNDNGRGGGRNDQQQQFDRNLKAIWTTLLILSTYCICFMPVVILFILVCEDCYIKREELREIVLVTSGSTCNLLLIAKPMLNPLIYASRMQEIRAATRRMNVDCRRTICPFVSSDELDRNFSSGADPAHQRFSFVSGSTRRNQNSINSVHLGNGFTTRTTRRRTTDVTTDL